MPQHSRSVTTTLVVAFACLSLLAAGCGSKTETNPTAAATTATPVTQTPTTSAPPPPATPYPHPTPTEPASRYQHTDQGAIETARYFVELLGYQASTADTSKMQQISLPQCQYCKGRIDYVKHVNSIGGWTDGYYTSNTTLVGYGPPPEGEIGDIGVRIDVDIPQSRYYIPDEDGLGVDEAMYLEAAVLLQWVDDRWMVLEGSGKRRD